MRRLLAAGALVLAAGLAQADGDDAGQAWRALFAQTQPAAAGGELRAVLAACAGKVEAVKALIASDDAYAQFPAGWLTRSVQIDLVPSDKATLGQEAGVSGRLTVEFFLRIPRGYSPRESWPVVLACHGQGGTGREGGAIMEELLGAARDQYLLLAPSVPGPKVFSGKSYQEQAHLKALEWARLNLNLDDDRIYVSGYSQGGHATWHLATMFPRLFAAAVPLAGVPWFEGSPYLSDSYLENTMNLPLWAIWGEKDRADPEAMGTVDFCRLAARKMNQLHKADFVGTELPGAGHGGCWPGESEFAAFLGRHRRQAAPEKFAHYFHLAHHARGYYVEATRLLHEPMDFDRRARVELDLPPGQKPSPEVVLRQVQARLEKTMFRLWVQLDRPGNALSIRAAGVGAVRVYVPEGLLDLSRPVTLRFGSATWRGTIAPSAECILKHYARTRDGSAPVVNEVDLDERGRVVVGFAPSPASAPGK